MNRQTYDPELANSVQQLNIWIHALTEAFSTPPESNLKSLLCRHGDLIADSVTDGMENSGRMSVHAFRSILDDALYSNHEIESQLLTIRQLGIGDQEILSKAGSLCSKTSVQLADLIRTLNARS
jgi:four helix bundle protein